MYSTIQLQIVAVNRNGGKRNNNKAQRVFNCPVCMRVSKVGISIKVIILLSGHAQAQSLF